MIVVFCIIRTSVNESFVLSAEFYGDVFNNTMQYISQDIYIFLHRIGIAHHKERFTKQALHLFSYQKILVRYFMSQSY